MKLNQLFDYRPRLLTLGFRVCFLKTCAEAWNIKEELHDGIDEAIEFIVVVLQAYFKFYLGVLD